MQIQIRQGVMCFAAIAALAMAQLSCSAATDSSTPTTPSTTTTTDTFSGSVKQSGTTTHSFAVATSGAITVSLTSVAPLSTLALGIGIGTWDGTTCSAAIASNDNVRAGGTALTGTALAGNYCVKVYDSGNITTGTTVTYTVQVTHP